MGMSSSKQASVRLPTGELASINSKYKLCRVIVGSVSYKVMEIRRPPDAYYLTSVLVLSTMT